MKILFTYWPNGSLSIISATSYEQLFWTADEEGNPHDAIFACCPAIHLTSENGDGSFIMDWEWLAHIKEAAKLKWFRFAPGWDGHATPDVPWDWAAVEKAENPFPKSEYTII